jgi:putative (di)nucleoside polyphosphate hydrolase
MRPGVGVVVMRADGLVFVGRRIRRVATEVWQFPQGGIDEGEAPLDAALRELHEETGIEPAKVELLAELPEPVEYELPPDIEKPPRWAKRYRGQRQHWYALRFRGTDDDIDLATHHPEFDAFRWVPLPDAVGMAVEFKREVYAEVGRAFAPLVARAAETAPRDGSD